MVCGRFNKIKSFLKLNQFVKKTTIPKTDPRKNNNFKDKSNFVAFETRQATKPYVPLC